MSPDSRRWVMLGEYKNSILTNFFLQHRKSIPQQILRKKDMVLQFNLVSMD